MGWCWPPTAGPPGLPGGGQAEFLSVAKLFPLGKSAAILSGGAGVSVPLTAALRQEIDRRRGLDDLDDVAEFALEFLGGHTPITPAATDRNPRALGACILSWRATPPSTRRRAISCICWAAKKTSP
jgi:hypothetical protein